MRYTILLVIFLIGCSEKEITPNAAAYVPLPEGIAGPVLLLDSKNE